MDAVLHILGITGRVLGVVFLILAACALFFVWCDLSGDRSRNPWGK